ncbi:hypothetical protein S40293_07712 [Stachybotrys chartarum IBT 40293]|nr:hypothetical protein S40293_07712 [Stachybotrys chartarum IBT 40293]
MNAHSNKLVPNDPRVRYVTTTLNGKTYRYILGEPEGTPVDTIFLIHGFPDMAFGWRCQIPALMSLGLRVVAPDCLGYAGTDAPGPLEEYSSKAMSADISELAKQVVGEGKQIILGGHDWGGAFVFRIVLWYPQLVKGVFSVCVPYAPPSPAYYPLEAVVKIFPTLQYQLQFAGPDVEARVQGREKVRQFLNALWGATTADGKPGFNTDEGVLFDTLPELQRSRLLSEEELDFYADEFSRREAPELHGPLSWYRTSKLRFEEEKPLADKGVRELDLPVLFIAASRDIALPPSMAASMAASCKNLTSREVDASHWALVHAADAVNEHIKSWLNDQGLVKEAKAAL